MSNVIRPAFGRRAEPAPETPDTGHEYRPVRVFGAAAGHLVALIRYDDGPEGPSLRIVVGPEDTSTIEAVAVMPATPEGETDAEVTAMAILRTLEVIEGSGSPASA